MRRREFVRAMISAMMAPKIFLGQTANPAPPLPAPVPWTLGLSPATPIPKTELVDAVAQADLQFFTATEMATLSRLSDVLLPPIGNKPGALAAETPAFLDFLIGTSPAGRQQMYQRGLDWLDGEAKRQFSMPFAKLQTAQADHILKPWLRTWMSDHPPTEAHADFINIAHADIRNATVNSRLWSEAPATGAQEPTPVGLYWSPIQPDLREVGATCMRAITNMSKATH
jgi:Gluconate 2-dehydrogenase subunit 3